MCTSKIKSGHAGVMDINGRPVLQPGGNRVSVLVKKPVQKLIVNNNINNNYPNEVNAKVSPPVSPKPKPQLKRNNSTDVNGLKRFIGGVQVGLQFESCVTEMAPPGSIAAAQREQASLLQVQRKMKIAHYGRVSASKVAPFDSSHGVPQEEKRCSFITVNSDPVYVAYHDEEWGVPVHEDKMLFELLALAGAQVGSDWTTILKKRQSFREAFAGFDAEKVAMFTEKQILAINSDHRIDLAKVRGIIDNAKRILEVRKEFGPLDKYLWGFVNHKPIITNYKSCRKIPAKTSKSEAISKDLLRRGFRFVGPTIVHSFMQAAGLTNDHLVHCPRHHSLTN
ncbi:Methyladenine glycosylase protein [Dioscorea alata]|uniref:Methyladenine glycosylase protein n=1 Tax=Dioscorea alata TaxID=55571 RepID=A0ACB7UNA9_DIOAL|nr:Methyladenine glycosylase protein [Dioscorea alata]